MQVWTLFSIFFSPDNGEFLDSLDYALLMKNVNTDNSYYDDEDSEAKSMNFVVNENNRLLWKVFYLDQMYYTPYKLYRARLGCTKRWLRSREDSS